MTKVDAMAVCLLAVAEEVPIRKAEEMWKSAQEEARKGHTGDCTKEPQPCAVCFLDRKRGIAGKVLSYVEDQGR